MVRDTITEPWREVEWDEAIETVARRMLDIRRRHGAGAIGAITSSRCTNEEVYVVQKMVRAAFGNNNVDTCARVCHSPTGYGLKQTFGESAGTQDFRSVAEADVIMVIGANPTDGHPVFASRMKRRLREGFDAWAEFVARPENSPEATEEISGVPAGQLRAAARLYATAPNGAIYYGLGVTEHSQGSTMVMGMANLAMACGNIGRDGVGVNPLRGQNNVQGSCDMGSFPHELPGYRHVSDDAVREVFENLWDRPIMSEPGLRIPNMFDAA